MALYPSRIQWAVIWGTALTALWMWIKGEATGLSRLRRFTVPPSPNRRAVALVVIGALVVCMLSDTKKLREVVAWDDRDDPEHQRRWVVVFLMIGLGVFVASLIGLF